MSKLTGRVRQFRSALRYLAKGDISGLINRLRWHGREYNQIKLRRRLADGNGLVWGIMCTPHTLFIAKAISKRLESHGIESEIVTGTPKHFEHDFYIVLCAQLFKRLPPADKRVVFQLEQSVSSRWFTPKYIKLLRDSFGVLEYSMSNIDSLNKVGLSYPQVHYLPIGASVAGGDRISPPSKEYDFIFYGDNLSSDRRREFLEKLGEKYNVKVCNDLFGEELYYEILKSRVVINIHYYDGALLEMPRLCECLSLGVPVLSEGTSDKGDYRELDGSVIFFEEGSVEDMMLRASETLDNIDSIYDAVEATVSRSAARFNFMFDRFLVATGFSSPNFILQRPIYVGKESNFFALSLPETIVRRRAIEKSLPDGCELFDGIRHNLGWVGCGSSFSALSRYAISKGLNRLIVIEDDADLPENFSTTLRDVNAYLDAKGSNWDIFSGLMADVHPKAKVLAVEEVADRTFVTLDKMTSTVFNIYNRSALELLSSWNPLDTDAITNTIDRYLERQEGLRVIVALPFIAGHKEEATSTLWGFENVRYTPMIAAAERRIEALVDEWKESLRK
jgi:hypothetical protein